MTASLIYRSLLTAIMLLSTFSVDHLNLRHNGCAGKIAWVEVGLDRLRRVDRIQCEAMNTAAIQDWLQSFALDGVVREQVAAVLENLPEEVRADLMGDPAFVVYDYEPGPGVIMQVPVRFYGDGKPGRSVVLKRSIKRRPVAFARWVIAHELAHGYLRHGGRWVGDDPEAAADWLAAEWGFPRPF